MSTVRETTRMAGLISGLDTEALIKAATANTQAYIDSKKQKVQSLQWKQEAYREVITKINEFSSKYLDIVSPDSIRANAVMNAYKAETDNEKLKASASSSAAVGKYTVTSAKAASAASIKGNKASAGTVSLNFREAMGSTNKTTVKVTLDGMEKEVTFKGAVSEQGTRDNFLTALNDAFEGSSSAKFKLNSNNQLYIENADGDNVSHTFTVGYNSALGLKNDASNLLSTSSTLGSIDFNQPLKGDSFEFSINGVSFKFDKDTTVKEMMNTVNKSDAGVNMTFSQLTQSFTIESKQTGAGQKLELKQTSGNLLNALLNNTDISKESSQSKVYTTSVMIRNTTASTSGLPEYGFDADSIPAMSVKLPTGEELNLDLSALEKTPVTTTVSYASRNYTANVYKQVGTDGASASEQFYSYVPPTNTSWTYYLKADNTSNRFCSVKDNGNGTYNLEKGSTTYSNISGEQLNSYLESYGIGEKICETVSAEDYVNELNNALTSAYATEMGVTEEEAASALSAMNVGFELTGEGDDQTLVFNDGKTDKIENYDAAILTGGEAFGFSSNVSFYDVPTNKNVEIPGSNAVQTLNLNLNLGEETVTINGTGENGNITFKDLADAKDSNGKSLFSYDEKTGVLNVEYDDVIMGSDESSALFINMVFGSSELKSADTPDFVAYGTNSQITINGVTLEGTDGVFSIDGVTFDISDVKDFDQTDIDNGDAEEIVVNVSKDNSQIKEKIKGFIEGYNELVDYIDNILNTSRPKSDDGDYYDPLTDDQKDELEQDEIDKWEEQAKQGWLYHDSTLTKVYYNLRNAVNTVVDGFTLHSMGLDTEKYDSATWEGKGKLRIDDEDQLDYAINHYGTQIAEFFTDPDKGFGAALNNAVKAATDESVDTKSGVAKGLLTSVAGVANTRSEKTNMLYNQIESLQTIIEKLKEKYQNEQERLWKQYSTLETYMNNMNNQYTSIFGTGTSTTG